MPIRLLALMLFCSSCVAINTRLVRVPADVSHVGGGFYYEWTPLHEEATRSVLACVGLPVEGPRPSLWVFPRPLADSSGRILMAFYDKESHAIIFAPYTTGEVYWPVFKHEIIHSVEQKEGHSKLFDKYKECEFWPALR